MAEPKQIGSIQFGLLSPKEIRKLAVTKIITPDTYDDDGYPIDLGLMDPKLGVIDPGLECKTCGGKPGECPGHFGKIELAAPVIHAGFARLIRKIMRATCRECGELSLTEEEKEGYREEIEKLKSLQQPIDDVRRDAFKEARKGSTCPSCGSDMSDVKFDRPTGYYVNDQKLMPTEVRDWLAKVPDEDLLVIGMNPEMARPEWMVLDVLPVPPVTMRPSITLETGQRSEDDLTHKLVDILRVNQRFQENQEAGAPQLIIEDLWELLQYHVVTFFDNHVSGIPPARHRSGRPLRTMAQRLKGKEGRFRSNLSGKRVNFSARTVISPDPNISVNEVGVPETIAKELTVTMHLTERNLEIARDTVLRGPDSHPGANYVRRADGRKQRISDKNREELAEKLEVGWQVDRHLKDGDVVLFNRQPSLHRMSIMAHEVRVLPYKTLRLNLCVCPPYNADFDGDEMNLHVPQTEEARAEAEVLMKVQNQMLSPRFGGPIIGGIHDHISGAFLLTERGSRFDRDDATELLRRAGIFELPEPEGQEDGQPYWTGGGLFSQLLPEDMDLRYTDSSGEPVIIEGGELVEGRMDDRAFGAFSGEILDALLKEYGVREARRFLDNATRVAIHAITKLGFSFGLSDEDLPDEAGTQIADVMTSADEKVENLIETYELGELDAIPGRSLEETLEMRIMQELGEARDQAGSIAEKFLGEDNSGVIMAVSGARGSMLNLTQMAASVGQQSVRGERITRGYRERTLPHFERGDLGTAAKGFVQSSYKDGLTPTEFFFHAMGGREGLVDTAVRTAQSGYMQRRLINALQDLNVKEDGTVRDTRDTIVQMIYGDDGIDPSKSDYGEAVDVERIAERVTGRSP
ncbi:MAG: DNA-directed RNA polymerase subunit A' [Methanonatronarchaeales archaeon]|nr:DNA-directed RNA polymerase subunit A' [Methanonatronarchaeales archaeon]